jgi:fibronectin type 3 domain-containing protein
VTLHVVDGRYVCADAAQFEMLAPALDPVEDQAPASPVGLSASGSEGFIALDWSDSSEPDLAGYNVYRSSTSGGTYTQLNGSLVTGTSYVNSGLTSGSTWFYRITAVDTSSNESAVSATVSATAN